MMSLPEYVHSMTFSIDGTKLAVAMKNEVRIITTDLEDWAEERRYTQFELNREQESSNTDQLKRKGSNPERFGARDVHSQTSSFSPDLCQLLVATQFSDDIGTTRIYLFDISNGINGRRFSPLAIGRQIPRVSTRSQAFPDSAAQKKSIHLLKLAQGSSDVGLFTTPCSHTSESPGRTSLIIGADTPNNSRLFVQSFVPQDGNGKRLPSTEPITGSVGDLEMKNIHNALAIDGTSQRFAVVTDDDKVLLLQRQPGGGGSWLARPVDVHLRRQRKIDEDKRQRVKMAAPSASEMTFFYISGGRGWLVTFDGSITQQDPPREVDLDSFHQ